MTTTNPPTLKKYRLDNLFCADTGDFDIKKEHITGVGTDVVTAGETDNGILGKTDIQAKIFPGNTLTVDMFGNCVYRPDEYKLVTHSRVFSLKSQNQQFNEAIGLYMVAALKKLLRHFTYSNMCSWNKIKHFDISLPSTSAGEIDWAYMEQYITELEQQCIAELDQYLIVSGLNDCELTEEDKAVLAMKETKQTEEFRLADIALLNNGNKMDKNKMSHTAPSINYISRTAINNGISDYVNLVPNVTPFSSGNISLAFGGSVGSCFLQEQAFYTGQNVGVITLPSDISNEAKLYLVSALEKKCKASFHAFGNEINKHFKTDLSVKLPICNDNNGPLIDLSRLYHPQGYVPDWCFMEHYIKAIRKTLVEDIIDWENNIIS